MFGSPFANIIVDPNSGIHCKTFTIWFAPKLCVFIGFLIEFCHFHFKAALSFHEDSNIPSFLFIQAIYLQSDVFVNGKRVIGWSQNAWELTVSALWLKSKLLHRIDNIIERKQTTSKNTVTYVQWCIANKMEGNFRTSIAIIWHLQSIQNHNFCIANIRRNSVPKARNPIIMK